MRIFHLPAILLVTAFFSVNAHAAVDYLNEYEEEPVEASPIPRLSSFKQEADQARARGVPILVEFSTPWCRYCEALEEHVLKPLILNGKYRGRIIVKKLEVNSYSSVAGFDGKQYSSDELSRRYQVDLYPTLVFFDANGREISQRLVGITVLEYVAGDLEKAIDAAVEDVGTDL